MSKIIEKEDLFQCRYYSSELSLLEERLNLINSQKQNIKITEVLLNQREVEVHRDLQEVHDKLQELGCMLEDKYGVKEQNRINWETGEIFPPQTARDSSAAEEPTPPTNPERPEPGTSGQA